MRERGDRTRLRLLRVYRQLPTLLRRFVVRRIAPSFTVGAIAFIRRSDGRILLVRQSYRDRWGVPGGLLDRREDAADAARREVFEETGLDIDLIGSPTVVVAPIPRRVDIVFIAVPAPGVDPDTAAPASVEIVDVGWFSPDDPPRLQPEAMKALEHGRTMFEVHDRRR